MILKNLLMNLGIWSSIGIALFSIFVVIVFRTRFVWKSRDKDGLLKKKQSLTGKLSSLILPVSFILLQIEFSYFSFDKNSTASYWSIFIINYMLFAVLFTYDTLVIDYIVLSLWKPKFLKIPSTLNKDSMRKHILFSIPIGFLIGFILTLSSVSIFYYLLL